MAATQVKPRRLLPRIGYFTNTYPRATDTFIQREVAGLRRRGFDVRTFSVRRSGADHDVGAEIVAEKKSTFYVLPVNPLRLALLNLLWLGRTPRRFISSLVLALGTARPGVRGLLWQLFYFQEAVVLAAELRCQQIQHLHNHLGDACGTVTLLACRLADVGYSMTFHGPHIFFDPTHWALREKVRHARFVACISHYCRSQMMLFSDERDWERLKIVRCGVDPSVYAPDRFRETPRKLLYVGRVAVEKGLPVLLASLSLLGARSHEVDLVLVGDGPDVDSLRAMAKQIGVDHRVVFAGYADQAGVRQHLRDADIFVLPSFAEGVPVSLMEAMASGVPVIATYVGGVAELVQDGVTGQLVFAGDPVGLKEAIARYIDDPALRRGVARRGREKVEREFDLDVEVDKLAALFAEHGRGRTA